METLIAALVLVVVMAVAFMLLALPFALIWMVLRAPRHPAPPIRPQDWTDDDEIAARHHH